MKNDLKSLAKAYAIQHLVPRMLDETRRQRDEIITHTLKDVKDRLTKEISYWNQRAQDLKAQEKASKVNARLNSEMAQRRADKLQARLQRRLEELEKERAISPQSPLVLGAALILPAGSLAKIQGQAIPEPDLFTRQKKAVEEAAMQAAMEKERSLGFLPVDVHRENLGWDIESAVPGSDRLRFIEVKGRVEGADTITVSKNEILAGLNMPDDYILAIVEVHVEG